MGTTCNMHVTTPRTISIVAECISSVGGGLCHLRSQVEVSACERPQHGDLSVLHKHPGWKKLVLRKEWPHELWALYMSGHSKTLLLWKHFAHEALSVSREVVLKNNSSWLCLFCNILTHLCPKWYIFICVCPVSFQESELWGWRLGLLYSLLYPSLLE